MYFNIVMDLKPPCEVSVKLVLPAIRLLIAKNLIEKYGYTQTSVARALGTTQAAISHYMQSKRGWKLSEKLMEMDDVRELLEKAVKEIAESKGCGADVLNMCQICKITQKYLDRLKNL
jgi:predicted transcriptional regulator